jgi:hypothetical protein
MAVDANRAVIALWQEEGESVTGASVRIGDSAIKLSRLYGVPAKTIRTVKGEYRVYSKSGIAFRVSENKVAGWTLFKAEG